MSEYLAQMDPDSLQNKMLDLERRLSTLERSGVDVNTLSDITSEAGEIDFRAVDEEGRLRMIMSAVNLLNEFGINAHLAGFNQDGTPEVWISSDDGTITAIGGALVLGLAGMVITGQLYPITFIADDGGTYRQMRMGMYSLGAGEAPGFQLLFSNVSAGNLVANPGYESSTQARYWTESDPVDWRILFTGFPHGGDRHMNVRDTGTLVSDKFNVAASTLYDFSFWHKTTTSTDERNLVVSVNWYDGSDVLISSDVIYSVSGNGSTTYTQRTNSFTSPVGAAKAEIAFSFEKIESPVEYFDDVSCSTGGGANLVLNPGFEDTGFANWIADAMWTLAPDDGYGTAEAHGGALAAWYGQDGASGSWHALNSDKFAVGAGSTYAFECWHQMGSNIGTNYDLKMEVKWYDNTPTLLSTTTLLNVVAGTTTYFYKMQGNVVQAPTGATQAEIVISMKDSGGDGFDLKVDDVSFYEVSVAQHISFTDDGVIVGEKLFVNDLDGRVLPPNDRRLMQPAVTDLYFGAVDNIALAVAIAGGTVISPSGTAGHPGQARFSSTNANPNNGGLLELSLSGALLLQGGETFECVFNLVTNHSAINAHMGFMNGYTGAVPSTGAFINITQVTLTGKTQTGAGGVSTTASSYTVSIGTWYRCKVVFVSSSLVEFYLYAMDGTLLWSDTLTTGIPAAVLGAAAKAYRTTAVATVLMDIDWLGIWPTEELTR